MSLNKIRVTLATILLVLALVALIFFWRQNAGLQVGGGISVPKMLWLAYAVGAWFVVPFFLWRDHRLDPSVRRIFGIFWVVMMTRGVIELVCLYGFHHWHPGYGIGHDLFSIGLLLGLRHRSREVSAIDCRALGFRVTLLVGLLVESAFAGMFVQTGAHQKAIYFVSTEGAWGFLNVLTMLVIMFAYPDLLRTLWGLYFPGTTRPMRRWVRLIRATAAATTVLCVTGALIAWTWMADLERRALQFQRVGFGIYESCEQLSADFRANNVRGIADFVVDGDVTWTSDSVEHGHPFELRRWRRGGPQRPLAHALVELCQAHPDLQQVAFKLHLLDEVEATDDVLLQLRFEITSARRSDAGLLRCRFRHCDDGRWRVTETRLIEGRTVTGSGALLVDQASSAGLGFTMGQDPRFTPGHSCDAHACDGPSRLHFQTMRHAYGGCAAADIDGDRRDDVLFCAGGQTALYRNRGDGSFEDVTERSGLADLWHFNTGGLADLDNDGDQDLFLGAFYGRNRLFVNLGDGTFRDITDSSGLGRDDLVTCFSYFDFDNDGDLDLYLGRFLEAEHEIPDSFLYARNGQPNILYRNDGDLRFTDVTESAGVGERGLTLSVAAADYDRDGDQDLYVANDFGRNILYQNQGDGTFRDVAKESGALAIGGSMSASWGDYDNDGNLDLYVGAIRSNQRWFVQPITARRMVLKFIREGKFGSDNPVFSDLQSFMGDRWVEIGNYALAGNSLLQQGHDGTFVDRAEELGARPAGWYWGSAFLDRPTPPTRGARGCCR